MRRALHRFLVLAMAFPAAAIYVAAYIIVGLALLADRVWPDADRGNCWSKTLPLWAKTGGYLCFRGSLVARMFGVGRVPHALHVRDLSGVEVTQTEPIKRYKGLLAAWRILYFRFRVEHKEPANRANWLNH